MMTIGHIGLQLLAGRSLKDAVISIFPDAFMALHIPRSVTHFTGNEKMGYSYIDFPKNVSQLKGIIFSEQLNYSCAINSPKALDEFSNIEAYIARSFSSGVSQEIMMAGLYHLREDDIFDRWIRKYVKVTGYDSYYLRGVCYNGKEIRKQIDAIEQESIHLISRDLFLNLGILYTNEWIETNIRPLLLDIYAEHVAETAFNHMKIDGYFNELVENRDWRLAYGELKYEREIAELHAAIRSTIRY